MSVALFRDGVMWGMLIGHHRMPHAVSVSAQAAVLAAARVLPLCLERAERNAREAAASRHEAIHVPVYALSADALPDPIAHYLARGSDGYLTKPFRWEEVLRTLEDVAGTTA